MSVECFIDTNVFIYHIDDSDARKHAIAVRVIDQALGTANACISHQVVQECLNASRRKARIPMDHERASVYLRIVLVPLWRVMPSAALYQRALALQQRYRFSFYDSLIVAAALEAGSERLLSEDLQDGQKIEGLTIEDPFRES